MDYKSPNNTDIIKDKEVILSLLNSGYAKLNKQCSVNDLIQIMNFLELNLKTKKGNWSLKRYNRLIEKGFSKYSIKTFNKIYTKRKKKNKGLETLLKKIECNERKEFRKRLKYTSSQPLQLKDKTKIHDFLLAFKTLKSDYLKGNNNDLIQIISDNINTGYTSSSLRNYYYNIDI